jgi:uncharacterized protein YheU (UPF0270 family)
MIIPHQQLSPEALEGILQEFIAREGTDYGAVEAQSTAKTAQLRQQLDRGEVVVVLDPALESVSLLPKREAEQLLAMPVDDEWPA